MNEEKDKKLERLLWDLFFKPTLFTEKDTDSLMKAWNVLPESEPEDALDARDRFIRTFC